MIYSLAVQFRGQSHNNEADGFDNLATVSEVIRHEENHLRTSVARVLGITNYERFWILMIYFKVVLKGQLNGKKGQGSVYVMPMGGCAMQEGECLKYTLSI